MMLKVWGRRSSFNVQKVLWLVGELGLPHEHLLAGGSFGGLDEPDFRALNPHGRVPVIEDDDVVVWESHTILRYLAAQYGRGRFWADDPGMRARVEGWMDWSQTTLQPDFLNGVFWGYYRTPEAQRDWPAIRQSIARCTDHLRLLDGILQDQPFLTGDRLSLADIPASTSLYRYFELDIDRPELPNVNAWYERLQQRPAYREHVMIPFPELAGARVLGLTSPVGAFLPILATEGPHACSIHRVQAGMHGRWSAAFSQQRSARTDLFVSGGAKHQVPDGGRPVAVIARVPWGAIRAPVFGSKPLIRYRSGGDAAYSVPAWTFGRTVPVAVCSRSHWNTT